MTTATAKVVRTIEQKIIKKSFWNATTGRGNGLYKTQPLVVIDF